MLHMLDITQAMVAPKVLITAAMKLHLLRTTKQMSLNWSRSDLHYCAAAQRFADRDAAQSTHLANTLLHTMRPCSHD